MMPKAPIRYISTTRVVSRWTGKTIHSEGDGEDAKRLGKVGAREMISSAGAGMVDHVGVRVSSVLLVGCWVCCIRLLPSGSLCMMVGDCSVG